jgi:spore coat protein U domain-containing protein, fimbrial subunit CupE1/2/3/6
MIRVRMRIRIRVRFRTRVAPPPLPLAIVFACVVACVTLSTVRVDAQLLPPPSCTLGMSSVAFGSYNPLAASSLDTTGTLTYSCNLTAPLPTIALSRGSSSSYAPRTMTSAEGGVLQYNLYLDALHLLVWGDGADLTTVRFIAVGLLGQVTFYGSIPARQSAPAGVYGDTLVATIYF